ncbi:MAG: hypothetical protein HYY06_01075, partial [Deltaproteobacteria bacterium]|nr:hypothetical protein [Deltaproteobacteria bacterium]
HSRFFDRSLGTITNGIDADTTGTVRPDALVSARLDDANHLEATYNASGDMETLRVTAGGVATAHAYEWDQVHRLLRATLTPALDDPGGGEIGGGEIGIDPPVESTFTYDYADQRRVKDSSDDTVLYVSDTFELRNGEPTKWLHAGPQRLLRVDATDEGSDRISFYLSNHLGTTSVVLHDLGDPRSASTYLPYGALESEVVAPDDLGFDPSYRFTGKERDLSTGLDYFGARYYAAVLGRWLSPDALKLHNPGSPFEGGPYEYARSNPLGFIDPDGNEDESPTAWQQVGAGAQGLAEGFGATGPSAVIPAIALVERGQGVVQNLRAGNVPAALEAAMPPLAMALTFWGSLKEASVGGGTPAEQLNQIRAEGRAAAIFFQAALTVVGLAETATAGLRAPPAPTTAATETSALQTAASASVETARSVEGTAAPAGRVRAGGAAGDVVVPSSRYPETAAHIRDAQAAGHPSVLTIERAGADANRAAAQAGHPRVPGTQLDEYPPAMFREGGAGASTRPVTPRDNMGAGACIGNQCRGLPDGTRVRIVVE